MTLDKFGIQCEGTTRERKHWRTLPETYPTEALAVDAAIDVFDIARKERRAVTVEHFRDNQTGMWRVRVRG